MVDKSFCGIVITSAITKYSRPVDLEQRKQGEDRGKQSEKR